jgi:glucosyl-3-phosphoglycerate synthase
MVTIPDKPAADVVGPSHYHVLLPIGDLAHAAQMMTMAQDLARPRRGRVTVLCIVDVPAEKSFSEGAIEARRRRQMLESLAPLPPDGVVDVRTIVRVSHEVWQGIHEVAFQEGTDLLLLAWKGYTRSPDRIFGRTIDEIMANPPCDVAVVKVWELAPEPRILVPVRGGPYAKLALELAESLAESLNGQITIMHAVPQSVLVQTDTPGERQFLTFVNAVAGLARTRRVVTARGDPVQAILDEAEKHDLVIMGASAAIPKHPSLGPISENIAATTDRPIIVVKTRQEPGPFPTAPSFHTVADISTVVDKWFAENTFHAREFRHVAKLVETKKKQGVTISLGLPALNEEATVGPIIRVIKRELMEKFPLLDEIVLIDSGSTDKTVEIARSLGIPVHVHQEILPAEGTYLGKGEALWKSLHVLKGDIIAWIDTDIANIHPKFVYGIIGPLLKEPRIQYVKGFYRRPLRVAGEVQAHGGGRVTELTARPLFNLFFPQLSGVIQPLSGEYAGRRQVLEQLPFFTGYGVETGLLVDIVEHYGLSALAQVDLQERIHRNQSLVALSRMSFVIIQVIMRRLEARNRLTLLEDMNRSMKLIHYERNRLSLEVKELHDIERPPIVSISEYRKAHGHD